MGRSTTTKAMWLLMTLLAVAVEAGKKKQKESVSVDPAWPPVEVMWSDAVAFFMQPIVIGSLVTCFLTLSLKPEKGLMMEFFKEFSGTIIMVICTFTPGPFFGHLNAKGTYQGYEVELAHLVGVLVADYICGGPHVNPGVTTAMFVWRKISLLQWILYVSAQMAGGIIAFPLLQSLSSPYGVKIGGPGIQPGVELSEAAMSEGLATLLLLMGIFLFATTHIGKYYPVKQPLIAGVIRLCIVQFGKTGPAINPMLATTWAFYSSGYVWPNTLTHFTVYWIAPMIGATAATLIWSSLTGTGPMDPTPPDAYAPKDMEEAWLNHLSAFGEQDLDKILLDYTPSSVITLFERTTEGELKEQQYVGLEGAKDFFEGLFQGINSDHDISSKFTVDPDKSTVFLVWACPDSNIMNASDTFLFDSDFKITLQHVMKDCMMSISKKDFPKAQRRGSSNM